MSLVFVCWVGRSTTITQDSSGYSTLCGGDRLIWSNRNSMITVSSRALVLLYRISCIGELISLCTALLLLQLNWTTHSLTPALLCFTCNCICTGLFTEIWISFELVLNVRIFWSIYFLMYHLYSNLLPLTMLYTLLHVATVSWILQLFVSNYYCYIYAGSDGYPLPYPTRILFLLPVPYPEKFWKFQGSGY